MYHLMLGYPLIFGLMACNEKENCDEVDVKEQATEDSGNNESNLFPGCLGSEHTEEVWELQTGDWFCVEIGQVGGNANFDLSVDIEESHLEEVSDFTESPEEGAFDMPSSWGKVYRTIATGDTRLTVLISIAQAEPEEQFSLQFTILE